MCKPAGSLGCCLSVLGFKSAASSALQHHQHKNDLTYVFSIDANVILIAEEDIWYPVLKAELYFIMCSNLPLRSECGGGTGRGHRARRLLQCPTRCPELPEMSVFRTCFCKLLLQKYAAEIKLQMGKTNKQIFFFFLPSKSHNAEAIQLMRKCLQLFPPISLKCAGENCQNVNSS